MKSPTKTISLLASAAIFTLTSLSAVETDPVGYVTTPISAGEDNIVSIPLRQSPSFVGSVSTASAGGEPDTIQITFSGTLDFSNDALQDAYYVRFTGGSDTTIKGKYFNVVSNTSSSVTIGTLGDPLTELGNGVPFQIVKYWTLAELFPPATQDSLVASTGNLGFQRGSELLLPDNLGVGVNRASVDKFFVTSSEWRNTDDFSNADNTIILPDSYVVIRQDSSAGSKSVVFSGAVPVESFASFIAIETVTHDNYISHPRPVDVTLAELDLGNAFTDSSGNLGFQRADELLVWENPEGVNPAPDKKFFRVGGEWRDADDFSVSNGYVLGSTDAFIIRKKGAAESATALWTNDPTY